MFQVENGCYVAAVANKSKDKHINDNSFWMRARGQRAPVKTLFMGAGVAIMLTLGSSGVSYAQSGSTYTVKSGDTLSSLAAKFGVSVSSIANANKIQNINFISIGQKLDIPASVATVVKNPTTNATTVPSTTRTLGSASSSPSSPSAYQKKVFIPYFQSASVQTGISVQILEGLAWQESGWNNNEISSAGAIGVGQLTPLSVIDVNKAFPGVVLNPGNAQQNILLSARYLQLLRLETGGSMKLALAAYYQGLKSIQAHGVFISTQHYVSNVLALSGRF